VPVIVETLTACCLTDLLLIQKSWQLNEENNL